jgi:hypothetical protein
VQRSVLLWIAVVLCLQHVLTQRACCLVPPCVALLCSKDLAAYIDWMVLFNVAQNNLLPQSFVNETFNFFGVEVNGLDEPEPLLDACVDLTNTFLGVSAGAFVCTTRGRLPRVVASRHAHTRARIQTNTHAHTLL